MKPQVNEQNGSTQNGDIATDAASVAMDAAAIVPTAATAAAASVGAVVPAKSGLQLKLEMLNLGNGNGEFGRVRDSSLRRIVQRCASYMHMYILVCIAVSLSSSTGQRIVHFHSKYLFSVMLADHEPGKQAYISCLF